VCSPELWTNKLDFRGLIFWVEVMNRPVGDSFAVVRDVDMVGQSQTRIAGVNQNL